MWKSIAQVKKMHNSASKRSCAAGLNRISQKDMALTQFGFMGFILIRSKMVGIHRATEDDWKGLVHLWRVIGHLMGIQERYNICKESVDETKQICELLLEKVFRPQIEKKDKDFLEMAAYMVNGLWCMSPLIQYKPFMSYLHVLVNTNDSNNNVKVAPTYFELTDDETGRYNFIYVALGWLRYRAVQYLFNILMILTFFLMRYFPFLAYYRFGFKKAHVKIPIHSIDNTKIVVKSS